MSNSQVSSVRYVCLSNSHSENLKAKRLCQDLTSAESITFLEEKQCKKQEELGTEARTKGKICKGEDHKEQCSKYLILQKLVFSIVSCQKMNVLFILDYMKRIQSQLSG